MSLFFRKMTADVSRNNCAKRHKDWKFPWYILGVSKLAGSKIPRLRLLNIPRCTHDIPPMYSWYPPDVLMISPRCTHGIPPMYWTPPDVLMVSLRCTEHPPMYSWYPPDVLMVSPRCTHGIPPMYSWYPPDVLMVSPRCTEHPPMYWTHIIQGGYSGRGYIEMNVNKYENWQAWNQPTLSFRN